jgi:hypothetical protein
VKLVSSIAVGLPLILVFGYASMVATTIRLTPAVAVGVLYIALFASNSGSGIQLIRRWPLIVGRAS